MAIYIRGDAVPFIITKKSVGTNPTLYGYWSNESVPEHIRDYHQTDRSRIVADGGANEVDAHLATLPCPTHGAHSGAICPACSGDCGDKWGKLACVLASGHSQHVLHTDGKSHTW